jgi:uncharacterized protein (TIGR00266 family)
MRAIVRHEPTYPVLVVDLEPNEVVLAEAGSMVARHADVKIAIALDASGETSFFARARALLLAIVRKWVSGAHFHANRFSAPAAGGWVWIAPALAGEVRELTIGPGATWTLAPGAYVASASGVKLRPRFAGFGAMLSRDATFWLDATGEGSAWLTGHGAIETIEVEGSHIVAADHLVAFSASLKPRIVAQKGQGYLRRDDARDVELVGRGRALVQARAIRSLVAWLSPRLPE